MQLQNFFSFFHLRGTPKILDFICKKAFKDLLASFNPLLGWKRQEKNGDLKTIYAVSQKIPEKRNLSVTLFC